MKYKKLTSPDFRLTIGEYQISSGIDVECFSSKKSHLDWCKVKLTKELDGILRINDMDEAKVELGYDGDFDTLIDGYVRCESTDYWKEIVIKDDLMKLERTIIKATFIDCTPQDVIRYILTCAGITEYKISDMKYGKKEVFTINAMNGLNAIGEVNTAWSISNSFYFQDKTFLWGCELKDQDEMYVLAEDETILSLEKYGDMWEAETIAIPWIHHSQKVMVEHYKFTGTVEVEKTVVKTDYSGAVHMYIYFAGGEQDV